MLGILALIVVRVVVVVPAWAALRLMLWLDEVKRNRRVLEPVDVSERIAVLEHDVLHGSLATTAAGGA